MATSLIAANAFVLTKSCGEPAGFWVGLTQNAIENDAPRPSGPVLVASNPGDKDKIH